MAKTIISVDNLTDPGQPLANGDRYRNHYDDNTFKDGRFFSQAVRVSPPPPIRVITVKAFYRRMTQVERTTLRGTADENINDLREDLQRASYVNLDDPELLTMLQATPLSAPRIAALLANGTKAEAFNDGFDGGFE